MPAKLAWSPGVSVPCLPIPNITIAFMVHIYEWLLYARHCDRPYWCCWGKKIKPSVTWSYMLVLTDGHATSALLTGCLIVNTFKPVKQELVSSLWQPILYVSRGISVKRQNHKGKVKPSFIHNLFSQTWKRIRKSFYPLIPYLPKKILHRTLKYSQYIKRGAV